VAKEECDHASDLRDLLEEKLRAIPYENLKLTRHVEIQCNQRGMPTQLILENLSNPDKLTYAKKEGFSTSSNKYLVGFLYSKRKELEIIVEFVNKHLSIITAYEENRKWAKRVGKWLKRPRRKQYLS